MKRLLLHAVKALLLFLTDCLCECGFSVLAQIKTKTMNCLEPEDDMRLALSNIVPIFDKVVEAIQKSGLKLIKFEIVCCYDYV